MLNVMVGDKISAIIDQDN
jgi:alpha-tubulin suppressor-like RCC1 family protein